MKKEMKKNNKMFLALVVVAALAMVSVAAVAAQSSDAEGTYFKISGVDDNKIVIDETSTLDWNIAVSEAFDDIAMCEIEISANAKYSGTLTIGVLSNDLVYTPFASMKLTNASNVYLKANIDCSEEPIANFEISNVSKKAEISGDKYVLTDGAPVGEFELTKGYVMLGADGVPFCGTVSAGDFSMKAEYVSGATLAITDDGAALISGKAVAIVATVADADADFVYPAGALSFSGPASVQLPLAEQLAAEKSGATPDISFASEVNVTIEDGAVITAGDAAPLIAATVTVVTNEEVDYAFLIDSSGKAIAADLTNTKEPVFKAVPFGSYTLFVVADGQFYRGNASISGTTYAIALGNNTLPSGLKAMDDEQFEIADDLIEFGTAYTFVYALKIAADGESASLGKLASPGKITFGNEVLEEDLPDQEADKIFLIMNTRIGATVTPLCFFGDAYVFENSLENSDAGEFALIAVPMLAATTDDIAAGKIKAGKVTVADAIVTFKMLEESTLLVKGNMDFFFVDESNYGVLDLATGDAYLEFEGAGIVAHQIDDVAEGGDMARSELPGVFESDNFSGAFYVVVADDKKISTYYLTSLNNAMDESDIVYISGNYVILEDTTLKNKKVIVTTGSTLTVGNDEASPTFTIPEDVELIISSPDSYEVVNGKAVYDVKPTGNDEPAADILIAGDKYTYTDIATALDMAVSGDVLELLRDAELKRDATVKAGVELKDSDDGVLEIPEEYTLTVNGKLTTKNGMIIDGTLRINNEADFDGAEVELNGTIDVTSTGKLSLKGTIISPDQLGDGILLVEGEANVAENSHVSVSELEIEAGKLSVDKTSSLEVTDKMLVGKQPVVSSENVNNATIEGVITLVDEAVATVYGVNDLKKNFETENGLAIITYFIDGKVYVTIYCDDESGIEIEMLYEDQLKDITILDWNNDRMFRGEWLFDVKPVLVGGADPDWEDWTNLYAKFEPKQYQVTLSYLQGMTWVVDGVVQDGNILVNYGTDIRVNVVVQPGFEGSPVLKTKVGLVETSYTAGNAFKVTDNVVFSATGVDVAGDKGTGDSGGLTLIEILLIIIVIIIAVIAIIIAIRLLRS